MTNDSIANGYAAMNTDDFNFYKDTYRPVETELIGLSQGVDTQNIIDGGLKRFSNLGTQQKDMQQRNMNRFGATNNAGQQNTTDLQNAMNNMAQRTSFVNNTRNTLEDTNMALKQDMIGLGRQLNTNAMGTLGGLASSATQRSNAEASAQAQNNNSLMSNLGAAGMNFLSQGSMFGSNTTPAWGSATEGIMEQNAGFSAADLDMGTW